MHNKVILILLPVKYIEAEQNRMRRGDNRSTPSSYEGFSFPSLILGEAKSYHNPKWSVTCEYKHEPHLIIKEKQNSVF